jgi:hypothetical protein
MIKRRKVKKNCKARIEFEGYVANERYESDGKERCLKFQVYSVNSNKTGKCYIAPPFEVVAYGKRAEEIEKIAKEDVLVEVRGNVRGLPDGRFLTIATYVTCAEPEYVVIDYIVEDKKQEAKND